jgi:hypothetical protein
MLIIIGWGLPYYVKSGVGVAARFLLPYQGRGGIGVTAKFLKGGVGVAARLLLRFLEGEVPIYHL